MQIFIVTDQKFHQIRKDRALKHKKSVFDAKKIVYIGGQKKQKRKKVTLKLSICQNLHMTMKNMRILVGFASEQNGILGAFQRVVDQPEWK